MRKLILLFIVNTFFIACNEKVNPTGIFEQDNNIHVIFSDGSVKQLTFNQSDESPILLPNKEQVFYVRNKNFSGFLTKNLMLVDIKSLKEIVLQNEKPEPDGNDGTTSILRVYKPELSLDGQYVLFVSERYVTSSQVAQVSLETGEWTELFSGESFEQINVEPYFGSFFVVQSAIGENGREAQYKLIDRSGAIVKEFENEEAMNVFRENFNF